MTKNGSRNMSDNAHRAVTRLQQVQFSSFVFALCENQQFDPIIRKFMNSVKKCSPIAACVVNIDFGASNNFTILDRKNIFLRVPNSWAVQETSKHALHFNVQKLNYGRKTRILTHFNVAIYCIRIVNYQKLHKTHKSCAICHQKIDTHLLEQN